MMTCSATEATQASKLYLDVASFPPISVLSGSRAADRLRSRHQRLYFRTRRPRTTTPWCAPHYRWTVITDLVRPLVTKLRPAGDSMPRDYLMVSTATFRNENY